MNHLFSASINHKFFPVSIRRTQLWEERYRFINLLSIIVDWMSVVLKIDPNENELDQWNSFWELRKNLFQIILQSTIQ